MYFFIIIRKTFPGKCTHAKNNQTKHMYPTYTMAKILLMYSPCCVVRFLDVLAARKDPTGLSGEVLIDGAPQPPNFKCLSGYVVQVYANAKARHVNAYISYAVISNREWK